MAHPMNPDAVNGDTKEVELDTDFDLDEVNDTEKNLKKK